MPWYYILTRKRVPRESILWWNVCEVANLGYKYILSLRIFTGDKKTPYFFLTMWSIYAYVWLLSEHLNIQLDFLIFFRFIMFKYFIFWTAHTKQAVCVYKHWNCKSWCLLCVIFIVSMSTQRFSSSYSSFSILFLPP